MNHDILAPSTPRRLRSTARAFGAALGVLAAAACLQACAAQTPATSDSAPAAATAEAVTKAESKPKSLAAGAVKLALGDATLSAAQRARVEAIGKDLAAADAAAKPARVALAEQIAAQITAGKLDRAALEPAIASVVAARASTKPAEQKALNDLHATLDGAQRTRLVEAARAKFESMRGGAFREEGKERLEQVADELELSDAQRRAIKVAAVAKLGSHFAEHHKDHAGHEARAKEIAKAFESSTFDAAALDVGNEAGSIARPIGDTMLTLVEVALPELTPAQRVKFADFIRAHASES